MLEDLALQYSELWVLAQISDHKVTRVDELFR